MLGVTGSIQYLLNQLWSPNTNTQPGHRSITRTKCCETKILADLKAVVWFIVATISPFIFSDFCHWIYMAD